LSKRKKLWLGGTALVLIVLGVGAFIAASILGLGAAAMSSTPAAAWCNGFGCGGFGGPVGLGVGAAIAAGSIAAAASAPAYYGPRYRRVIRPAYAYGPRYYGGYGYGW